MSLLADLDHTNDQLRKSLKDWMRWLKTELGFDSFRFDFAKALPKTCAVAIRPMSS